MKQHNVRARRQGALERLRINLSGIGAIRQSHAHLMDGVEADKKAYEKYMKQLDSDERRMRREIATLEERLHDPWAQS